MNNYTETTGMNRTVLGKPECMVYESGFSRETELVEY